MSIQTLKDSGVNYQITSSMDGAVYRLGSEDCVCGGLGDEFTPTYSANSLDVSFSAGSQCVICGNFFKVMETEVITLPASSTGFLCARINTSKASGQTGSFEFLTEAQIKNENINGSGTTSDLKLYEITTDTNGVTNIVDKRFIKEGNNFIFDELPVGETSVTITNSRLKENSILSIYTSKYGVNPESVEISNGQVILNFDVQEAVLKIGIKIEGSY